MKELFARRPAPRGDDAARLRARGRRGDRAAGHHGVRAALQGGPRRNRHAVDDEGHRAHGPAEDGLPRAEHAHADRRLRSRRSSGPTGVDARHRQPFRSTTRRPIRSSRRARPTASSSSRAAACGDILRKAKPQRARRPHRAERAVPARPAAQRHGGRLHRAQAGQDRGRLRACRSSSRSSRETYGVIAYQEQVMRIAHVLGGFSLGEADLLRKAMGKKNPEVMAKHARQVRRGRRRRRASREEVPTHIFDLMEKFAGYGFNKSHSTAYALPRVPDGVPQGELPVALRGVAADHRVAEHRQARAVSRRVPRARDSRAAARREREPAALHGRAGQGRALRPDGHQERRRGRRSSRCWPCARSRAASRRCTRSARNSTCGSRTSACSKA